MQSVYQASIFGQIWVCQESVPPTVDPCTMAAKCFLPLSSTAGRDVASFQPNDIGQCDFQFHQEVSLISKLFIPRHALGLLKMWFPLIPLLLQFAHRGNTLAVVSSGGSGLFFLNLLYPISSVSPICFECPVLNFSIISPHFFPPILLRSCLPAF